MRLPSSTRLALVAQICALVFLACLLLLHGLTLRSLPWYMSEYANSPYRAVFIGGAYAFALALASLALGMARGLPNSRRLHAGLVLLALVVPFAFLVATFPVDAGDAGVTWPGRLHDWSTIPMFLFLNAALVVMWPGLRLGRDRRLARLTLGAGLMAAAMEAAYLAARLADEAWVGVAQRLLVAVAITWCLVVAGALRRQSASTALTATTTSADREDE